MIVGMRMGMIVLVGMCHSIRNLAVVVACGGEGIDDLAVGDGKGRMRDIGRDHVNVAWGEAVFLAADGHFQLAVDEVGDLFVDVFVFGERAAFFGLPESQGTALAVDHFSEKAGDDLFGGDIVQVLHAGGFDTKVGRMWISGKAKIAALVQME